MARGKSITEIQILNLLNLRPMYGAEMIDEIKRLSGNTVIMSSPTLYSALHKLADKKLVNSYWQEAEIGGRRHVYNITKAGREYREKNQIEINYELLKEQKVDTKQTYATLEEAFSLPLNNQNNLPELPNDKRVLTITPTETTPQIKITPYVLPTDKITTTAVNKPKQMEINLTGTVGDPNLRPLVNLNDVPVGNDFVSINRLWITAGIINLLIFIAINFLCSLTHSAQSEFYYLIYIGLILYFSIIVAIYFVFPKIKAVFINGKSFRRRALISLVLVALVILICLFDHSMKLIWLSLFAFVPVIEGLIMISLRKGKVFRC